MRKKVKIITNDNQTLEFGCMADAIKHFNIKVNKVYAPAYRNNISAEEALQKIVSSQGKRIAWRDVPSVLNYKGKDYYSYKQIHEELHISPDTIKKLKDNNKLNEKGLDEFFAKRNLEVEVEGKKYNSCRNACQCLGISYNTFRKKLETGLPKEECLRLILERKRRREALKA